MEKNIVEIIKRTAIGQNYLITYLVFSKHLLEIALTLIAS